jgi:phosphatidylserine/phosphatidylglycerophosphate/cardiolipin synthase-like enzyme
MKLRLVGFLPLLAAACDEGAPNQEITTAALVSGWSDCELQRVFALLNDPATTASTLTGVHSRAASNLVTVRNGADAAPGTADDVLYTSYASIDAVPYVGDVALATLQALVAEACTTPTPGPDPVTPSPACLEEKLLAWLNDPGITAGALVAAGVASQASNRIVAARKGADGAIGTADDVTFGSLAEVDAVPYVGEVALTKLQAAVAHLCVAPAPIPTVPGIDVVFSPQDYANSHLVKVAALIDGAQRSIDIAMYSYKDTNLAAALDRAVKRSVSIRMIYDGALADKDVATGGTSGGIENLGVDVRYINKTMHHKVAVIDGPRDAGDDAAQAIVITGSANWSNSGATRYDENTLFIRGNPRLALLFQKEFNHLWANSRNFVWNPALTTQLLSAPVTNEMIPADAATHAVFTSANFRTYVSTTNGPTFAVLTGKNTAADQIVALIQSAEHSIHIASGHLRSRPISEALKAKADASPGLDIKIILDGQEYVSYWAQAEQEKAQADCLLAAGTSAAKIQKCYDVDYKYGNDMHVHGGIALKYKFYAYRWDYAYAKQLHHKFVLVDGRWLSTGSYNFSDNAEHATMENVVVLDGTAYPELLAAYEAEFQRLWTKGEAGGLYPAMLDQIANDTGPIYLVFEAMALDTDQIYELKKAIRTACPDAETPPYRDEPSTHQICFR